MPPSRKRPAVPLSKVPSVKELCDRLGFERATPTETSVFTDTTHAFRKSYKASNGSPGSHLIDWYSSEVQQELSAMAVNFLEQSGNGERFWSDSRRWKEADNLSWPEDKTQIADLLKQLFWKQNKYALNNQTYGEKKYGESRDQSRDRVSPARESGWPLPMISSPTFQSTSGSFAPAYTGAFSKARDFGAKSAFISLLDENTDVASKRQRTIPLKAAVRGTDIFDVPEDESSSTGSQPRIESPRYVHSMQTSNKSSPRSGSKRSPGESPSAKRPKSGEKDNGKKSSKRTLISPKRTSTRAKAPRIRPETVPDEQIEELLKEKTPDDKAHSVDYPPLLFGPAPESTPVGGFSVFDWQKPSASSTRFDEASSRHEFSTPLGSLAKSSSSELANAKQSAFLGNIGLQSSGFSIGLKDSDLSNSKESPRAADNRDKRQEPLQEAPPARHKLDSNRIAQRSENSLFRPAKPREQVPNAKPTESSFSDEPIVKSKPRVRGAFWIVTSPEPNYSEESWNNGRIKGKSLSTVISEISDITNRDCIEKLKIKLRTPFAQTTTTVHKEAEDHWGITVSNLEEKIKEAFGKDKDQQTHFQIWIEPLYDQNAPLGGINDVENGEIDW